MPRFQLKRRTVLRGILGGSAVAVGLPLLEAMLNTNGDAYAGGEPLPVRFMTYYWADGVNIARFEPAQTGAGWALSEQMMPLAPVQSYINICTGLRNLCSDTITHHEGMTVFNGYSFDYTDGLNTNAAGPTIDQLIADAIGDGVTPVRAVHVQVSKRSSTDGDGGTTVIAMSHRGEPGNLTANVPQTNPQDVWQTLFGNFMPPVDDKAQRTKVLDAVRADVARLKMKLGEIDKQRLDAHLQGVDELEAKIVATTTCDLPDLPGEDNVDSAGQEPITPVTQAMGELIAYAFACDVTRVASFLFKKFVSSTVFDEINATNQHHSASHNGPDDPNYRAGVLYQMERLAQVLQIFQNTEEVNGENLLDSTIVYASTECSTGQSHAINRQPIILAGHGRGYLVNPGIHYRATAWNGSHGGPNGAGNTSDVLLACLQAFDPSATSVGGGAPQSNTPLTDIVA
jgi:hypothetical protein